MATEQEIRQILKENPPAKQFVPYCFLSKEADSLTAYFEGDADYSERLNDHITVYRSLETNEIIGCRVKGVSNILKDLPNYIRVNDADVELQVLFFAFVGGADESTRKTMNDLAKEAANKNISLEVSAA